MRIRLALVAVVASLALGAVAVSAATTPNNGSKKPPSVATVPAVMNVPVKGFTKGKQFTGTYHIQRFKVGTLTGKKGVYSVGTLTGTFGKHHITRYGVMAPATLSNATGSTARQAQATTCTVLHLVLGPINLSLLGLNINLGGGNIAPGTPATEPITLNITATQGAGLLGNLLCDLTNGLGGSGLSATLQQLASALNSLAALISGGGGTATL